jgi:hypothetical protein
MLDVCEEFDLASICKSPLQSGTLTVDENVGTLAAAPLTDDQMQFVETLLERAG